VNLFTEPLATREIAALFPEREVGRQPSPEAHYDLGTFHAACFGGSGRYIQDKASVLAEIREYVASERARS
jgi:hypothetical protein